MKLELRTGMVTIGNIYSFEKNGEWEVYEYPRYTRTNVKRLTDDCYERKLQQKMRKTLGWYPYVYGTYIPFRDGKRYGVIVTVKKDSKLYQAYRKEGFVTVDLGS